MVASDSMSGTAQASRCFCGAEWIEKAPDGYTCARRHFVPRGDLEQAWLQASPNGSAKGDHRQVEGNGKARSAKMLSAGYRIEVPAERKLVFRTAREIAAETPAEVDWIARPYLAKGTITEVDGKIKRAGKTTWITHLLRKVLDGEAFLGELTRRTGVVYLTEQVPRSFRASLARADLLQQDDFVVVFWHDTLGLAWPDVVGLAAGEASRRGYEVLAVDTLSPFAGITGDSENNAGAAQEAMRPLKQVAAQDGLAVIVARHERKSGGEVGDSGRGSSAFGGDADTLVSIRRGDGNVGPNVRVLHALSRFDEVAAELVIEYVDGDYRVLGTQQDVRTLAARRTILEAVLTTEADAISLKELWEATKVPRGTGQPVIDELFESGHLRRVGAGKKGDPFRYWRPQEMLSAGTSILGPAERNEGAGGPI
jgi:hypothetical protein